MSESKSGSHLSDNIRTVDLTAQPSPGVAGATLSPGSEVVFDTAGSGQKQFAFRDIVDGLRNVELWSMIGWADVRQRYRRSTIGPFWVTISMAVMVGGLGLIYSEIFKTDIAVYLPFVCLGLIVWEFISKSVLEGCTTFLLLEGLIKQIRMPLTTHVASLVWRQVIIFAHNIVVYVIVAIIFGINPGFAVLWFIPGFLLVVANLLWIVLALALTCARFRDVPTIVMSAVQILFFVTPIFWLPSLMPTRTVLIHGNVIYHLVELMRAPLMGSVPSVESWVIAIGLLIVGWVGTFVLFSKFRRRIAYWL